MFLRLGCGNACGCFWQGRQGKAVVYQLHLAFGLPPGKNFNTGFVRLVIGTHKESCSQFVAKVRVGWLQIVAARGSGKGQTGDLRGHPGSSGRAARPGSVDHVYAGFAEQTAQVHTGAECPKVFTQGFPAAPAAEYGSVEEAPGAQRVQRNLPEAFPQHAPQSAHAVGVRFSCHGPHFVGAVAQVRAVQAVNGKRQQPLEAFHFPEDEGLCKQRIPQQNIGHVGQTRLEYGAGGLGAGFRHGCLQMRRAFLSGLLGIHAVAASLCMYDQGLLAKFFWKSSIMDLPFRWSSRPCPAGWGLLAQARSAVRPWSRTARCNACAAS